MGRAVVRGEVKTSLEARSSGPGSEATQEVIESVTESVFNAVLGRKRFEEYRDQRQKEYWVRCLMSQEEADAAMANYAAGRAQNLDEVMMAVQKADLAFQTLMQIRDKLFNAYQEISQLRI